MAFSDSRWTELSSIHPVLCNFHCPIAHGRGSLVYVNRSHPHCIVEMRGSANASPNSARGPETSASTWASSPSLRSLDLSQNLSRAAGEMEGSGIWYYGKTVRYIPQGKHQTDVMLLASHAFPHKLLIVDATIKWRGRTCLKTHYQERARSRTTRAESREERSSRFSRSSYSMKANSSGVSRRQLDVRCDSFALSLGRAAWSCPMMRSAGKCKIK